MAAKTTKIIDVKGPDKTVASASGRPLIVSNRPVLTNDPMVVVGQDPIATSADQPTAAEPTIRTVKTIEPLHETATQEPIQKTESEADQTDESNEPAASLPESADTVAEPASDTAGEVTPAEPEKTAAEPDTKDSSSRDVEAQAVATESEQDAAKIARAEELEQLIAKGTYAVPINAVQRKRSRLYVLIFCLLAVVLALLLLDAILDAGIVTAPKAVPHSHFFSTTL